MDDLQHTVFIHDTFYFRVDLVKYPSLKDVEYFNVTMEPGDCLFIPYKWYVLTHYGLATFG